MADLKSQQQEVFDLIIDWVTNFSSESKKIFKLIGKAGTGKSTVLVELIKYLDDVKRQENKLITKALDKQLTIDNIKKIAVIAPTNKAAKVLKSKGVDSVITIHNLLYSFEDEEEDDKTTKKKNDKLIFRRKDLDEIRDVYWFIIVDEGSMVTPTMEKDLLEINLPILLVGDSNQLPPILSPEDEEKYGRTFSALKDPHYNLTEIQRQVQGSPIIVAATKLSEGGKLNYFDHPKLPTYKYYKTIPDHLRTNILLNSDMIIVGTNNTVKKINTICRKLKKINPNSYPIVNEKLIVWTSPIDLCMSNGDILINISPPEHTFDQQLNWGDLPSILVFHEDNLSHTRRIQPIFVHFLSKEDTNNYRILKSIRRSIRLRKGSRTPKFTKEHLGFMEAWKIDWESYVFSTIVEVGFNSAITAHKSQGSEWDKLLVINESWAFKEFINNWMYTSITRAKTNLIICDYLFPYGKNADDYYR